MIKSGRKDENAMEQIKLFDAELLGMEYLWENGPVQAAQMAEDFLKKYNWKKSTTYIVLKRLEGKNALRREEPKYRVVPLVTREQVQLAETSSLVDKFFAGSFTKLFANFLASDQVSDSTLQELQELIDEKRAEKH